MTKRDITSGVLVATMALVGVSLSAQTPVIGQGTAPQLPGSLPASQMAPLDKYVVGQAKPPEVPGSTMVDLTLEQAQQIALEKNLDLQVAKMDPTIQDYGMVAARAAFRPQITGSFTQNHSSNPVTSSLDGGATSVSTQSQQYRTGISQPLRFWGANVSASFSSGRNSTTNSFTTKNPGLSAGFSVSYSQNLLQGRSIDGTRNGIRTREITRQTTDIQLLATIENTKASVRSAYWALRQAIESIEIRKRTLSQATQLLENDKIQVQVGTMAGIDTAQPEVAVTQAEQGVLTATIAWQQAEMALKRLLVGGKDDDLYRRTINPVDQAILGGEPSVNIDAAVQNALSNRTDIQIARKNIESSELTLQVTKNQTLPNLGLNASYSLSGSGGPTIKSGVITVPGGYIDALGNLIQNPTWSVGLNFTYPLGMVAAKANLASAQISMEQAKARLKVTELTIATDVTNAGLAVQNSYQSYLAAKKSREAQEKATEAEQTKFSVGTSQNFTVVQQQNSLTSARLSELQALISYLNAVADFEKKQRIGG